MVAQFEGCDTLECMTTTLPIFNQGETVLVPVVTLEEMPRLTSDERNDLIAELDQIETDMKAGAFEVYSREWLRNRFLDAFGRTAA